MSTFDFKCFALQYLDTLVLASSVGEYGLQLVVRLKSNQILMLFIFFLMNKMCSGVMSPRIIARVPRVPIVQSDHYHCYQIAVSHQRQEGRPGEAGANILLLRHNRTLCYPGAAGANTVTRSG